jgi:pimeloyl-ACP methyl ester carboxylesterase
MGFTKRPDDRAGKTMTSTCRTISANAIDIFIVEEGRGPLVILCHGWPELSFSWRHQMPALAAAGFRVVSPDMRGFGRSSAPTDIAVYSIFDLVGDMVRLTEALGEEHAVIIGHDWGAQVAWHCALFRPDVFKAVAGLSVPFGRRGSGPPLDTLRKQGVGDFYWHYFQTPGVAERELERDVERSFREIMFGRGISLLVNPGEGFLGQGPAPKRLPDWLDEKDLAFFVSSFTRTGFRGGLNWYRNIDRNWRLTAPWHKARLLQPALFIAGSHDPVITGVIGEKRLNDMDAVMPRLTRKIIIEDAGHWIQQERPAEVNAALLAFLKKVARS